METNPLRERWRESKAVVNGWIAIPDGFSAEIMAHQGWDSITVDMQHGVTHYDYRGGVPAGDHHHQYRSPRPGAVERARHCDEGPRRRSLSA